jgi:DNA-directed RNA polymerase subunit RPC12/RpoP
MKCIRCGTDNTLKDRTGNQGRCKSCNHPFVFEPTSMGAVKVTDPFFAKAIADLSVNNTLFFTPQQLRYFLDHRLKRKKCAGTFGLVCGYLFLCVFITVLFGAIYSNAFGVSVLPFVFLGFNLIYAGYLFSRSHSATLSRQARRSNATTLQVLGIVVLVSGAIYGVSYNAAGVYWLATLVGLAALWLGFWQKRRIVKMSDAFSIGVGEVQGWLENWARINGAVTQLLSLPTNSLPAASPNLVPDPDVTNYSFDRLVVCQSDAIAQMLIANNFHFENNCAILSLSGYPQRIFEVTMQMLHRNPDLHVFAFHDCSPKGMELAHQLRTADRWFANSTAIIVDIGLSPRQILAAKRDAFIQNSNTCAKAAQALPTAIRQTLSIAELQWLEAGNFVELESFTPQKLIQVLNRSIANSQQLDTVEDNSLILIGDGGGSFYATDSFG